MDRIVSGFAVAILAVSAILGWQLFLADGQPTDSNGPGNEPVEEPPGNGDNTGNGTLLSGDNVTVRLVADYVGDPQYSDVVLSLQSVEMSHGDQSFTVSRSDSWRLGDLNGKTLKEFPAPENSYNVSIDFDLEPPEGVDVTSRIDSFRHEQTFNLSEARTVVVTIDSGSRSGKGSGGIIFSPNQAENTG